jgi:hypothetical protein
VPDTDPGFDIAQAPPDHLICPPREIFDRHAIVASLNAAADEAGSDASSLRAQTVQILRHAIDEGRSDISSALE